MTGHDETGLLTVEAVAERLAVSPRTVYRLMSRRELIYVWVGYRRRVPDWALRDYLTRIGASEGDADRST